MTIATATAHRVGNLAEALDIPARDVLDYSERAGCKLWWIEGINGPQDWWFTKRYAANASDTIIVDDITFDLTDEQREAFATELDMTPDERAAAGL